MVATASPDLYAPFPHTLSLDDGPQSSEEGSGVHSPVFEPPFPAPHGDSSRHIRYNQDHLDVQRASILASELGYNPMLHVRPPFLNNSQPVSGPDPNQLGYRPELAISTRSQLTLNTSSPHLTPTSRPAPPSAQTTSASTDYSVSSERSLSGASHDTPYLESRGPVSGPQMNSDHGSASPSTEKNEPPSNPASAQREKKEVSIVVIACRQCRARKIRCDSTRPTCNNCVRRSNECQYDAVPKRRGPDKRPGTRQRSCKKRPADGSAPPPPSKKKRSTMDVRFPHETSPIDVKTKEENGNAKYSTSLADDAHLLTNLHLYPRTNGVHNVLSKDIAPLTSRRPPLTRHNSDPSMHWPAENGLSRKYYDHDNKAFSILSSPSVEYNQKIWWDELLSMYSQTREQSLKDIVADLSSLFSGASYWLSFINPNFLKSLYTDDRLRIQPSFVLAGLAMAMLMRSSETELGSSGRDRALWLRNTAQASLESSWNSRWIDLSLAEAALLLALFESSPHPEHTSEREASSLVFLDNIVRYLTLPSIDVNEPGVSRFAPHNVPIVSEGNPDLAFKDIRILPNRKCLCIPSSTTLPQDHFNYWSNPLPWDPSWSPADVRKEETRRFCWSALNLVASYVSRCVLFTKKFPDFYLSNPANFAIFFPGEASDRTSPLYRSSPTSSPKESVWALYCRSMLLWNFCIRLRNNPCSDEDKAEFALDAWAEIQTIQDSLDTHVCNLNTTLLYIAREYLCNSQMTIVQTLRSIQGLQNKSSPGPEFSRQQAEEWLYYQNLVVKRVKLSINHPSQMQGSMLTRRPFQAPWFSNQLAICLSLWEHDRSLSNALELAKTILLPLDVLNVLWPCPAHQSRCEDLRRRLTDACVTAGVSPPSATDFALPHIFRTR